MLLANLGIGPEVFFHQGEAAAIKAQAEGLTYAQCRERIQTTEKLAFRLERYLPAGTALEVACSSWA